MGSVEQIGASQSRFMTQQFGIANQTLNSRDPTNTSSYLGAFASTGSQAYGAFGQLDLGAGFAISAAVFESSADYNGGAYGDARLYDSLTIGGAIRYVAPGEIWQPFIEVGGWIMSDADLQITRAYANGAGVALGVARLDAELTYINIRGGVVYTADAEDRVMFSAELGRERLKTDPFREALTNADPFEAHYSAAIEELSIMKLSVGWSHTFNERLTADFSGTWAHGFDHKNDLVVTVPGFGPLTPTNGGDRDWAEYGASVSYQFKDNATLSVFATGVSGEDDAIGSEAHVGVSVSLSF